MSFYVAIKMCDWINSIFFLGNQKKNEDDEAEIKKQLSKYDSQLSANEEKLDTDDRKCQ